MGADKNSAETMKDDPIDDSISQTARGMEENHENLSQSMMELKERDLKYSPKKSLMIFKFAMHQCVQVVALVQMDVH